MHPYHFDRFRTVYGVVPINHETCGGLAQLVERRNHNPQVGGSWPSPATIFHGANVTQLVEFHLAKVVVEGSNPFVRSIFFALMPGFRRPKPEKQPFLSQVSVLIAKNVPHVSIPRQNQPLA